MTNKKFKKAAMALALTACVAATPLAANAETPENAADVQAPAAVDHTEADTQEAPDAELPAEEEPEAQPAAQPAAPEATPIAVELPTAEETPEEKEETPVEVTPTEDAVVEKETPAEVTPTEDAVVEKETPAKVAPAPAKADVDNLSEDPDADIATMDGAENAVNDEHEAKIGETSYGTLQGAIDSAGDGDTVVLNKNTSGSINIAKWIKLNLNGHTINGDVKVDLSGKKDDTATSQDGKTTVDKKVEIVDGTITGSTTSGVTIKDAEDTNVLLKDLTIEDNKGTQGGGVHIENSQNVTIDHCIIRDNKTTEVSKNGSDVSVGAGGGVFVSDKSHVTITDSQILDNTGTRGGGIYTEHSTVEVVEKSEIKNNIATDVPSGASNSNKGLGGGIYSFDSTVTVEDSTFEKNTATDDGGAIAATQNSSLTVRNSKVLENKAADTAGGILAEKSTLEVTDSIIDGNRASVGGGLYIADIDAPGETKEDKPEHTITRTKITNNTADGQGIGGGIYLGAQKLTITDSKLTGNNTISNNGQTQGGAIVAYSPGDFTLDNTLIQGNTADVGGGIHVLSTKLRDSHIILCNNTRITGNVANLFGGGIFLDNLNNPAVLELVNASVDNNTANVAGGIGNYGSIVVLKDGAVLENNTAKQYGGGLYNRGKVTVESGATLMNNTASTYGGGLYNKGEATVESGAKLYNNHAALAGDDIYLAGKNSTLTLTKVGDDWMLDDCGHKINGWFADLLDARWDADGKQEHVINLKDYAADGLTIVENEDGSYTITILDENATLALKAAHNVTPKPTPDPDPEPTPDPDTPDTPVSPEGPTTPPVQDATPEDAETPVNPENPANPPVQDATPDSTVAALPKTGVNWFTALAMALSGMALMAAGAFTSLFAKSKH